MVRGEQRLKQALEVQARAADATLRSNEEQFRLLVQGVTDYSIYLLGLDGRVATWNAGARRIKGYEPDEIIGQHFSRFYTEEDRQNGEPERALATAMRDGRFEKEGLRVRKNGEHFWANVIIDAIRDDEGKIIAFAKIKHAPLWIARVKRCSNLRKRKLSGSSPAASRMTSTTC
jgi:PAS domain S-box-containing protein